ncbi:MAG: hypothetical protein PWP37_198 [Thermotogota bacterium]|nr:hypothetical protein [Thermotogota bacterium]MDK2864006.1 hypothetical protein [Thermotogota bacterium]HCZ06531.1 hypothetical protein [Thermotogota bacterium]
MKLSKVGVSGDIGSVIGRVAADKGKVLPSLVGRVLSRHRGFLVVVVKDELLVLDAEGLQDLKSGDLVRIWDEDIKEHLPKDHINARLITSFKLEQASISQEALLKLLSLVDSSSLPRQTKVAILSALDTNILLEKGDNAFKKIGEEMKRLNQALLLVKPFGMPRIIVEDVFSTSKTLTESIVPIKDLSTGRVFLAPREFASDLLRHFSAFEAVKNIETAELFSSSVPVGVELHGKESLNDFVERVIDRAFHGPGRVNFFPGFAVLEDTGKVYLFHFHNIEDQRSVLEKLPFFRNEAAELKDHGKYTLEMPTASRNLSLSLIADEAFIRTEQSFLSLLQKHLSTEHSTLNSKIAALLGRLVEEGNKPLHAFKIPGGWLWSFKSTSGHVFSVEIKTVAPFGSDKTPPTARSGNSPSFHVSFQWSEGIDRREIQGIVRELLVSHLMNEDPEGKFSRQNVEGDQIAWATNLRRVTFTGRAGWQRVEYAFNGGKKAIITLRGVINGSLEKLKGFPSVRPATWFVSLIKKSSSFYRLLPADSVPSRVFKLSRMLRMPVASLKTLRESFYKPLRIFNLLKAALDLEDSLQSEGKQEKVLRRLSRESAGFDRIRKGEEELQERIPSHVKDASGEPVRRVRALLEEFANRAKANEQRTSPERPIFFFEGYLIDGTRFLSYPELGVRELWIHKQRKDGHGTDKSSERYTVFVDVESSSYGRVKGMIDLLDSKLDVTIGLERGIEQARSKVGLLKQRLMALYAFVRIQIVPSTLLEPSRIFKRRGSFDVYA